METEFVTFKNSAAQGDVHFQRFDKLPKGVCEESPRADGLVIAHSETGHDHVMVLDKQTEPAAKLYETDNPLVAWLQVNRPTNLVHKREHHTHKTIQFQPGIYRVSRQRRQTQGGIWKRVED